MNTEKLFTQITETLASPASDYHKLKKSLRLLRKYLGVDRCSLLYPCHPDATTQIIPVESTTQDYPGASKLKTSQPLSPLFQHLCKTVGNSSSPVCIDFKNIEPTPLLALYEQFSIKALMAKLIKLPNGQQWGLILQQCSSSRQWSDEAKEIINKAADLISPTLTSFLDIPTLLNAAEFSADYIDKSPFAQVIYNMDRQIVYANEPYCLLKKLSFTQLLNQNGKQFIPKKEWSRFNQLFDDILEHGKASLDVELLAKQTIVHVETHGSLITYNGLQHYVITLIDLTEKIETQQQLQSYSDIQHAIMEASDDGILVEDTRRRVITINQTFFDTFDLPNTLLKDEATDNSALGLLNASMPACHDHEKVQAGVRSVTTTSSTKTSSTVYLKNGKILDLSSFPLIHNDTIKGRVWYFKNITENTLLTQKLSFEATHDPLTQLINRRGFDNALNHAIDTLKDENTAHALLYLDLDQFKIINDDSGHASGDLALVEVSQLLLKKIRSADILARVGGDEFCILLKDCPPDMAQKLGEEIRQDIDNFTFMSGEKEYSLGVSIGIVIIDKTVMSYEEALKLADTSCYIAKEAGRNQIHFHTNEDQTVALRLRQNKTISQIHEALKTNQFVCYVQKICAIPDAESTMENKQYNYEVLVRMLDKSGKIIAPNLFLPAAERHKLMYKIDHWVIENSLHAMATIQDQFNWVSINLSGQTIAHEDTFGVIKNSIEKNNLAPGKVCFEITETAAIISPEKGLSLLNKLQKLGCLIALDDFGTGLSSYEYLKQLPSDILKIDGQFIKNMLDDPIDLAMVKSMNDISHTMGKKTVGEFVENAEILEKMQELGIDYAQGFYLDTPKPLHTLLAAQ
jgi:diguanylate cyclase (GGDEF)-like protein/PAS domain S-box-containing protein